MSSNKLIYDFSYTGAEQSIKLPSGLYMFEAWGAGGGLSELKYDPTNNSSCGGEGGYTKAIFYVRQNTTIYIYVGAKGDGPHYYSTGKWAFNGGAPCYATSVDAYDGGGATDISLSGTDGSTIWNDSTHLNSVIIQAKGGQGQGKSGGTTTGTYSNIRIDARTEYINRYGVHAAYIIPKVSGQLIFQSTNYSHDPYGFVDNQNNVCIASNDDSGSPYTGHSWDFRIVMNVTAGTMYKLRVGSYASSLGTTEWTTWFATFPDSKVVLYTVVTSGGNGGGKNYTYQKMYNTSISQYANSGNGFVRITKVPERLNSNYYKDTYYQEYFDFSKLVGD